MRSFGTSCALVLDVMREKLKALHSENNVAGGNGHPMLLRCGDTVPQSGIYEALHMQHNADSEGLSVVALRGETVQPCADCGEEVRLRLLHAAPHISEDADF